MRKSDRCPESKPGSPHPPHENRVAVHRPVPSSISRGIPAAIPAGTRCSPPELGHTQDHPSPRRTSLWTTRNAAFGRSTSGTRGRPRRRFYRGNGRRWEEHAEADRFRRLTRAPQLQRDTTRRRPDRRGSWARPCRRCSELREAGDVAHEMLPAVSSGGSRMHAAGGEGVRGTSSTLGGLCRSPHQPRGKRSPCPGMRSRRDQNPGYRRYYRRPRYLTPGLDWDAALLHAAPRRKTASSRTPSPAKRYARANQILLPSPCALLLSMAACPLFQRPPGLRAKRGGHHRPRWMPIAGAPLGTAPQGCARASRDRPVVVHRDAADPLVETIQKKQGTSPSTLSDNFAVGYVFTERRS